MSTVKFFQQNSQVWISIAFQTNEIVRVATAADFAAYPGAYDTYNQSVGQGSTPTTAAPLNTSSNDPQGLVPNTLQVGDSTTLS